MTGRRMVRATIFSVGVGVASLASGGSASAVDTCYGDGAEACTPGDVRSDVIGRGQAPPSVETAPSGVLGVTEARGSTGTAAQGGSRLPVTGGDAAGLAVIGGALVAAGGAFVVGTRRRQDALR